MKNHTHSRLFHHGVAASFFALTTLSQAVTTLVSTSRYSVTEGVAFTLGNIGASDFTFNWTDPSGAPPLSSVNIADPTLTLTLGQTYTFQRTTGSHPFVIMNSTASAFITGADGNYSRLITSTATDINNATLFTASPAPGGSTISWTPNQVGDFYYTCSVTSHQGMSGKINVIPEPSALGLIAGGFVFGAFRRRRVR